MEISQSAGNPGEPPGPVFAAFEVQHQLRRLFCLSDRVLLLFPGLLFCLLRRLVPGFFHHFGNRVVLLAPVELRHLLAVEEHDVDISFRAPAAVASVTVFVRFPDHCVAVKGPFEISVGVAAESQVGESAAFDVDQGYVAVVPSSLAHIVRKQVLAVRRPLEPQVAIGVGIVDVLQKGFLLSVLEVADDQLGPVPEEGYPFPVRGDDWLETGLSFSCDELLVESLRVSEAFVLLVRQGGRPYSPMAVSLRRIIEGPPVFGETDVPFLLRGVGDPVGCLEFLGGDENVAPDDDRDLLARWRDCHR